MGKLDLFTIELDDALMNPLAVYKAGQKVSGKVRIRANKPIKCRGVNVKMLGESRVHWSEQRTQSTGQTTSTYTVHFHSHETYVDNKMPVFTPSSGSEDLQPGEFTTPFTFLIPPNCPESFESDNGKIRYQLKANIDKPWKIDDYCRVFFTVIRDFDLNKQLMDVVGPFSADEDFNVKCCFCCNTCGQAQVALTLPKRGFVPGEVIPIQCSVKNVSKVDLSSLNFEIYQRTTYRAQGHTHTTSRVLSCNTVQGLSREQSRNYSELLPVGSVPSSYLEGCNNIRVVYYFRLYADGGCCVALRKECCELVIGTIPLLSIGYGYTTPPQPPSYEESIFGRVTVDKDEGRGFSDIQAWAPAYPVYYFPSA